MTKKEQTAISPTRQEDYPEWYQQVIKAADLAESSIVRGCMIIKPWGFGIWEKIQSELNSRIKELGSENVYFPLFIPVSLLEKEAAHVEGFAKECAVVTHHRLEVKDGKLIPVGKLEEPLVVRPTSEAIIGTSFSKWIQSHRDLPLRINQWVNVVRWEMRPRLFLRTTEFLWQEGHTAHTNSEEAREETIKMLNLYQTFCEDILAIPVIPGEKTPSERFPGADSTYTIEAMMQDRKALQSATSHYLGQNFAKAFNIKFSNSQGELDYAFTTSWGTATRLIGGLIMVHSDDNGLRLPPRITPHHVVIVPFVTKPELEKEVYEYADKLADQIRGLAYHGQPLSVIIDKRDMRGGEKNWQWIKKGIPIRIEVGPRDIENQKICVYRRDCAAKEKGIFDYNEFNKIPAFLDEIQSNYLKDAKKNQDDNTYDNINNYEEFVKFFTPKNVEKPEIHGGFVLGKWCEDPECENKINQIKVSIRCLPMKQRNTKGRCIICGKDGTIDAIYAKSY